MARPVNFCLSEHLDRRSFLAMAASMPVASKAAAASTTADAPLVIPITDPARARTEIEAWNVGLITAHRTQLPAPENDARNVALAVDLMRYFGRINVRGRYVEYDSSSVGLARDVHAYLIVGNDDDSGNLKGLLRKFGRKYDQDAFIYKGYYRDAEIHALRDLQDLGLADKGKRSLGQFRLDRMNAYYSLISRRCCKALPLIPILDLGAHGRDWHGGRWEDIGFWTVKGFFSRVERRMHFEKNSRPA